MSTDYKPEKPIPYEFMKKKCKDIRFLKDEHSENELRELIYQNGDYLHFWYDKGRVIGFTRWGNNEAGNILAHIEAEMNVTIHDEHSEWYYDNLNIKDEDIHWVFGKPKDLDT